MNSIVEAEVPSARDFITGPILGNALAGYDIEVNTKANPAAVTEAYLQYVLLLKPILVVWNKYGQVSRRWADRVKLSISYSEEYGRFRLRVMLGHAPVGELKVFRRYKFEYSTYFINHDAERQMALDLIVKQYQAVYAILRTTEFGITRNFTSTLCKRGFKKFTTN